jgi:hypothetical protein
MHSTVATSNVPRSAPHCHISSQYLSQRSHSWSTHTSKEERPLDTPNSNKRCYYELIEVPYRHSVEVSVVREQIACLLTHVRMAKHAEAAPMVTLPMTWDVVGTQFGRSERYRRVPL